MEEEIVPLFPASTNYPTISNGERRCNKNLNTRRQRNHHINSNSNGALMEDVEKAEMTFNGGVATSLRCEDGVYRRLYQQTSGVQDSATPSEDEGEEWSGGRRGVPIRHSSCRCFLFCIIVISFLFLLYVPAYNNVAFRPDASTLHDRVHSDSSHHEMSKRLLRKTKGGTVVGWSYNKSRNMRTYVLPDNVTALNQPKSICKLQHQTLHQRQSTPDKEPDIFLLVIITSSMAHYNRRVAIRETWGNQTNYEFLAKRLQNITDHFANVNMTESLFSELGYSSSNDSLEDKRERIRRDVTDDNEFVLNEDSEFVPMLDEGNQITNVGDVEESQHNSSNEKHIIFRLVKDNGANSYRRKQALLDETSKHNLDSAKQNILYTSYKQLDRMISSNILNIYTKHNLSQERSAPYRSKRETSPDEGETDKIQAGEDGEKRAIYDEVEEDALGNFETTDAEPLDTPEDYDYQTEESNVMRIPRRGEANVDYANVKKALEDIKNTLELSMKNDKLSLKYFSDKNTLGGAGKDNKHSEGKAEDSNAKSIHPDISKVNKDQSMVKTKYLFLLGQSANENDTDLQTRIDEEAALYGDIIQEGFIDSYNNLTLKSVMLLKWVITNCGDDVHYIMKTDDDMFINIPRLIQALKNKSDEYVAKSVSPQFGGRYSDEKLLIGDLICQARPISDMRSKWYSPTYMYSGKVYPRYLSGVGYVMSMGAARDLYQAALDTPLFHLEDIFITGMCSRKAGIKPQDHSGFSYSVRKFNLCVYMYLITAHQVTPSQMRQMYGMLASNNTHPLEACEAKRLVNISPKSSSSKKSAGRNFLGSPRNILTGLAGFGYVDSRNKKLRKANNGCS